MGDFLGRGVSEALGRRDYIELVFWCFGFLVAVIALFIISKWIKAGVARKVSRLSVFGMGFDDLEHMKRTGLISEDEIKMVRRRMSEKILEAAKEDKIGDKTRFLAEQLAAQLATGGSEPRVSDPILRQRPRGPVPPDIVPPQADPTSVSTPQSPPASNLPKVAADSTSRKSSDENPVDLDSLHEKGIISDQEYDQLRNFFGEKKSGGAT